MTHLLIQLGPAAADACALCGQRTEAGDGPQLVAADPGSPVCRACGLRHAPGLVKLLDLARTAERVGQIGRHGVFPPITALLELARAAEEYSNHLPRPCRQAA